MLDRSDERAAIDRGMHVDSVTFSDGVYDVGKNPSRGICAAMKVLLLTQALPYPPRVVFFHSFRQLANRPQEVQAAGTVSR
jgi:hypothetical protein